LKREEKRGGEGGHAFSSFYMPPYLAHELKTRMGRGEKKK